MLIKASELATSKMQWLVDGMLPRGGGTGFAYGPRWTAKSLTFSLELPLAIGNPGHDFLGRKVVHGSVVVCMSEGTQDAGLRFAARKARQASDDHEAWLAAQAGSPATGPVMLPRPAPYTDDRIAIMTDTFAVQFDRYGASAALQVAIMRLQTVPDLELVVLDAAEGFTGGGSLSSVSTAAKFMAGLKYMSEQLKCFVLVINHQNTAGTKMKGAGDLEDGADVVIAVTPDYMGELPGATLSCEKNKAGRRFDPVSVLVHPYPDGATGDDVVSATVRLAETEEDDHVLSFPAPVPDKQPKRTGFRLRLVEAAERRNQRRTS